MKIQYKWLTQVCVFTMGLLFSSANAGTWTPVANPVPLSEGASCPLLLTDGSILFQNRGFTFSLENEIWKLTPNIFGSYTNGTWTQVASLPAGYDPLLHASAVLADGRVIYFGGFINNPPSGLSNRGAIYDPVLNTWTEIDPPSFFPPKSIGAASCVVLFDGTFMLACSKTTQAALLDLKTLTWTETGAGKVTINDGEGWTLLPNGKVLTVDTVKFGDLPPPTTNSEIYDPATGTWTSAGSTIHALSEDPNTGIGPAVLRPNGTVLALGANGLSSLYSVCKGIWKVGPTLPVVDGQQLGAQGPAALLPNGNVLIAASPFQQNLPNNPPLFFFEFDGKTFIPEPAFPPRSDTTSSSFGNMLVLPTGQILYTYYQQFGDVDPNNVEVYTPSDQNFNPKWAPVITKAPTSVVPGKTYKISGRIFNGMAQGAKYGSKYQSATNYPLVRITNDKTNHVFYARTHDHSFMGVASKREMHTFFDVPANIETGCSRLEVVTNGIPSKPLRITVKKECHKTCKR